MSAPDPQRSRKRRVELMLDPETFEMFKAGAEMRAMRSRSEYLRWLIRSDATGHLLYIDKAFERLVDHLASGFGTAVGYIAAEMERAQLEIDRKRKGGR